MGFIYILTHDRMPGLVKIGFTTTSVSERVSNLSSSTGVPGSFTVFHSVEVDYPREVEGAIHTQLRAYRHKKEFFEIKPEVARTVVTEVIQGVTLESLNKKQVDPTRPVIVITSMDDLGATIRHHRKKQGLRQDDLAGLSGVGTRFLIELEAGKATAQIGKALQVMQCLGLKILIT